MIEKKDGIILLNKDPDITSFKALNNLKKIFNTKKIGHTGTLDKFAEGLIIALVGKYTRLAQFFTNLDKEYIALFEFGIETETIDPEGKITNKSENIPELEEIEKKLSLFKGKIKQIPPDFSAVHINGKRAYKIALDGKKPEIPPRDIIIHDIEIISYEKPFLKLRIECSKGTYIRSLARDIAESLNTKAYVKELQRTKVGSFNLENSIRNSNINTESLIQGKECFNNLSNINTIDLKTEFLDIILKGGKIYNNFFCNFKEKDGLYAVFLDNNFLALMAYEKQSFSYKFVIPRK